MRAQKSWAPTKAPGRTDTNGTPLASRWSSISFFCQKCGTPGALSQVRMLVNTKRSRPARRAASTKFRLPRSSTAASESPCAGGRIRRRWSPAPGLRPARVPVRPGRPGRRVPPRHRGRSGGWRRFPRVRARAPRRLGSRVRAPPVHRASPCRPRPAPRAASVGQPSPLSRSSSAASLSVTPTVRSSAPRTIARSICPSAAASRASNRSSIPRTERPAAATIRSP
jgi:hypothetical protein